MTPCLVSACVCDCSCHVYGYLCCEWQRILNAPIVVTELKSSASASAQIRHRQTGTTQQRKQRCKCAALGDDPKLHIISVKLHTDLQAQVGKHKHL